ncbi:hypothetical protein, partial [Clostridium sp.]|uniref:hypothetical protein n=1 Tax=Clostridium sp. TaxID=1506 RepID=UPI00257FA5FA
GGSPRPLLTYPEIAVIYKAMAKSLFYKPLAILIIEESYLQRFFHTLRNAVNSAFLGSCTLFKLDNY